jgi:hypothetical protein
MCNAHQAFLCSTSFQEIFAGKPFRSIGKTFKAFIDKEPDREEQQVRRLLSTLPACRVLKSSAVLKVIFRASVSEWLCSGAVVSKTSVSDN